MRVSSAKAKGRRLQQKVRDFLRERYRDHGLEDGDIESIGMGQQGSDIVLSPAAKRLIPFDIECKNTEGFNRNSAINQSESNSTNGRIPLVVFKRNKSKIYAIMSENNFNNIRNSQYNYIIYEISKSTFNIWKELEKLDSHKLEIIKFYKDGNPYIILEFDKIFL